MVVGRIIKDFGVFDAEKACVVIVLASCFKIGFWCVSDSSPENPDICWPSRNREMIGRYRERAGFPSHVIDCLCAGLVFTFGFFPQLLVLFFLASLSCFYSVVFFPSRLSFRFLYIYIVEG